jgi:hypothetical protein
MLLDAEPLHEGGRIYAQALRAQLDVMSALDRVRDIQEQGNQCLRGRRLPLRG